MPPEDDEDQDDADRPPGPAVDLDALPAARGSPRATWSTGRAALRDWPAGTPPLVRTPLALLVVVVLAVLATGGVLGHRSRSATESRVAAERAIASMEVAGVALRTAVVRDVVTGRPVPPVDGRRAVQVRVLLDSAASHPFDASLVDVEVEGVDDTALEPVAPGGATGRAGATDDAPTVVLVPGEPTEGSLDVVVTCTGVPRPSLPSAWAPVRREVLVVTVPVGREVREERLPLGASQGGVGERLALLCHPAQEVSVGISSAGATPGGDLEVVLRDAGSVPARVALVGRWARQVVTDPALPLDLPRGGSTRLLLHAAPDCAAADPLGDVLQLRAVRTDGPPGAGETTLDGAPLEAWWSRAVTLACG